MSDEQREPESRETSQAYLLFGICFVLVVCLGSVLQGFAMRPGFAATLVLLILTPALLFIRSKKVGIVEGLRLRPVPFSIAGLSALLGLGTWGLGMLVARGLEGLGVKTLNQGLDQGLDSGAGFALSLLVAAIGPGICEEAMFRGAIQGVLERKGRWFAVFVSAALFGVLHMMLGIAIPAALMGVCYGWVVVRTGSIVPAMIAHATNNATALSFLYFLEGQDPSWLTPCLLVLGAGVAFGIHRLTSGVRDSETVSPLSGVPAGLPIVGRLGCVLPLFLFAALTLAGMSALPYVITMEQMEDGDTIMYANRDTFLYETLVQQSGAQVAYLEDEELKLGSLVDGDGEMVLVRGSDDAELSIPKVDLKGVLLRR